MNHFFDLQNNRTANPCSCQDCTPSCPVHPPPPSKPKPLKIMGLDLLSFGLLLAYLLFLMIFIPSSIIYSFGKNKKCHSVVENTQSIESSHHAPYPTPVQVDSRPGVCARLGSKMESALCYWFTRWGIWCSSHPFVVMVTCLVMVGALACGVKFFTVTTDPVDLWSSPNSEARDEKDVYDSKFNPFFRTEQLIIRPKHPVPTGYHHFGDGKLDSIWTYLSFGFIKSGNVVWTLWWLLFEVFANHCMQLNFAVYYYSWRPVSLLCAVVMLWGQNSTTDSKPHHIQT